MYLKNVHGIWYFRCRLPADARKYFGRNEIKRSLHTKKLTVARRLAKGWSYRLEKITVLMRSGMLDDQQIKNLVDEFFNETLIENDEHRVMGGPQVYWDKENDTFEPCLFYSEIRETVTNELLGLEDKKAMERIVSFFLARKEITLEKTSIAYLRLKRDITLAYLDTIEIDIQRDLGNFEDNYPRAGAQDVPQSQPASPSGRKISEVIVSFLDEKKAGKNCKDATLKEYQSSLGFFVEFLGDRSITEVERDDIRAFLSALQNFPKHLHKKKEFKGKSLKEVLAMPNRQTISDTTIRDKYLGTVKALFRFAFHEGLRERDITAGLLFNAKEARQDEQREAYSTEDIQRMLKALEDQREKLLQTRPERYWVTMIGLYSGMRVEEICQLRTEDVRQSVDGIWFFAIRASEGETKTKTSASERDVPIHPALIQAGLIRYYQQAKEEDWPRLWMKLSHTSRGYSRSFGNWFNGTSHSKGFNRSYITEDKKKTFHSLRHSFTTALKYARVEEPIIKELIGHSHGSITLDRYGKPFQLKTSLEALENIVYPVD